MVSRNRQHRQLRHLITDIHLINARRAGERRRQLQRRPRRRHAHTRQQRVAALGVALRNDHQSAVHQKTPHILAAAVPIPNIEHLLRLPMLVINRLNSKILHIRSTSLTRPLKPGIPDKILAHPLIAPLHSRTRRSRKLHIHPRTHHQSPIRVPRAVKQPHNRPIGITNTAIDQLTTQGRPLSHRRSPARQLEIPQIIQRNRRLGAARDVDHIAA